VVNFVLIFKFLHQFFYFFEKVESSQNKNVKISDDENEGLNECNMKNEMFDVNFQTKQSIIE